MSDMLSHWAIFEDCRKIAAFDAQFDEGLSKVIESQLEYARLGTVSRGGNRWMQPLMERARAVWDRDDAHPQQDRKLAFALGGLPHQAIDNVIKPYREVLVDRNDAEGTPVENIHRWAYAYQDAFLFQKVFASGEAGDGYLNSLLLADNDGDAARAIEAFARTMVLRGLQGLHTLKPYEDDMDAWLDGIVEAIQPVTVDIQRLVEAQNRPDPAMLERFKLEEEFYSSADPVIALAEKVRGGGRPGQDEIDAALDVTVNKSVYGRALAVGIQYMREGTRFWRGETEALDTPNYNTSAFWAKQRALGRGGPEELATGGS